MTRADLLAALDCADRSLTALVAAASVAGYLDPEDAVADDVTDVVSRLRHRLTAAYDEETP